MKRLVLSPTFYQLWLTLHAFFLFFISSVTISPCALGKFLLPSWEYTLFPQWLSWRFCARWQWFFAPIQWLIGLNGDQVAFVFTEKNRSTVQRFAHIPCIGMRGLMNALVRRDFYMGPPPNVCMHIRGYAWCIDWCYFTPYRLAYFDGKINVNQQQPWGEFYHP